MAENKKIIILLGGRSNLAKGLIKKNKETKHFSKIILFSQTNNNAQHSEAFVQIEKALCVVSLFTKLQEVFDSFSDAEKYVVFAGTPSDRSLYRDEDVLMRALNSVVVGVIALSVREGARFFIVGSSLIFVPFLYSSSYKTLKRLEYDLFQALRLVVNNIHYIVCHPIRPVRSSIGGYISISISELLAILFSSSNKCVEFDAELYTGGKIKVMTAKLFQYISRVTGWR